MRNRFATLVVACAIVAGCSSPTSQPSPTGSTPPASSNPSGSAPSESAAAVSYKVDYANFADNSDFLVNFGKGFKDAAATVGFELKYYNNNCDDATTLSNAKLMVQDKPDVILFAACNAGLADSIGKVFTDAGIPCIAVNVALTGCPLLNQVNKTVGEMAAKGVAPAATAKGWDGTNTTILLVQFSTLGVEINDCVRYFYTTLADTMPGFDKVDPSTITASTTKIGNTGIQVDGKSLEEAYTNVKNILTSIPADRNLLVMGTNDPAGEGALRAITEAGRAGNTLISGQGGGADGIALLRSNPIWVVEPSVFNTTWSQYAMAMIWASLHDGVKLPPLTTVPQGPVDKTNVDTYYDVNNNVIALPPLDDLNGYLEATGILQKFKVKAQGLAP